MNDKKPPTRSESKRKTWRIDLRQVVESANTRDPTPPALRPQWSVLTGRPNDLWALATSANAARRGEFVNLCTKDDDFVAFAATFLAQGQLEPIELRDNGAKAGRPSTYTIVFGHRRALALLFIWCEQGGKGTPWVEAYLAPKVNEVGLLHRSLSENLHMPPSPIETAKALARAIGLSQTVQEVADERGMSTTWVKDQLRLLELPVEIQRKIEAGTLKPTVALREQQEVNGEVRQSRIGLKKRVKSALAPFAQEVTEKFFDLIEKPDVDPAYKVSLELSVSEIRAILALLESKKKEAAK